MNNCLTVCGLKLIYTIIAHIFIHIYLSWCVFTYLQILKKSAHDDIVLQTWWYRFTNMISFYKHMPDPTPFLTYAIVPLKFSVKQIDLAEHFIDLFIYSNLHSVKLLLKDGFNRLYWPDIVIHTDQWLSRPGHTRAHLTYLEEKGRFFNKLFY